MNLTLSTAKEVYVRGKKVTLTSTYINDLLEQPNIDNDDYIAMLKNVDWEMLREVLQEVTVPGTKWITSNFGNIIC